MKKILKFIRNPILWVVLSEGVIISSLYYFGILSRFVRLLEDGNLGGDELRNITLTIGAIVALPFVIWRTIISYNNQVLDSKKFEQTQGQLKIADDRLELDREKDIRESFEQGIRLLSSKEDGSIISGVILLCDLSNEREEYRDKVSEILIQAVKTYFSVFQGKQDKLKNRVEPPPYIRYILDNLSAGFENQKLRSRSLEFTEFNGHIFKGYTFKGLRLRNCSFENCEFIKCSFEDCDLAVASFKNSNLNLTLFTQFKIHEDYFDKVSLENATLIEVIFRIKRYKGWDFRINPNSRGNFFKYENDKIPSLHGSKVDNLFLSSQNAISGYSEIESVHKEVEEGILLDKREIKPPNSQE